MPVSLHVSLSWGVMVDFVSPKIFRQTSTDFSRQLAFLLRCRGSLLYVADLLVLSTLISLWRSYSAGLPLSVSMECSLQQVWLRRE